MSSAAITNGAITDGAPAFQEVETSGNSSNPSGDCAIIPMTQLDPSRDSNIAITRPHDKKTPGQLTRFLEAVKNGHDDEVQALLGNRSGAIRKWDIDYALLEASARGYSVIAEILIGAAADVNSRPGICKRHASEHLQEKQYTSTTCDEKACRKTALQAAAEGGHTEIVSILLKAGAKANELPSDHSGRTALQAGAEGGYAEIVRILLEAGAITEAGHEGRTALKTAVEAGHMNIVLTLLDASVDINVRDKCGQTCLTWAISRPRLVQSLLENGADIHSQALDGKTPLHYAVKGLYEESASILLNAGANIELKDYGNRKPLDIALHDLEPSSASFNLVKLLLEHGCDIGRREMSSWRKMIKAGEADVVIITKTPNPRLTPLPPVSDPSSTIDGGDPVKAVIYGISSVRTDMVEGSQESPIFDVSCDPESPIVRRHFSTSNTRILFPALAGKGSKFKFPSRSNPPVTNAVVDWRWLLLDGDSASTGCGLFNVQNLGAIIDKQAFLSCYVSFDFLTQILITGDENNPHGNAFQTKRQRNEISWIMRKPCIDPSQSNSCLGGYPIFRSEDFRGTLNIGWIPDSGLEFFTLFVVDLHKKWRNLLEGADSHLAANRKILLLKKGKTTNFIDNLLSDAQQWSDFRDLLQIHVHKARDILHDFRRRWYLCYEVANLHREGGYLDDGYLYDGYPNDLHLAGKCQNALRQLLDAINGMEEEIKKVVNELDEKTKDMIELEFNLVSIYEARTSKTMGMNIKRLTWITFIFLPLMFVASLFGMNVDIINGSTARWWTVIVLSGALFALVILSWAFSKSIRAGEESEGNSSAESLPEFRKNLRFFGRRLRGAARRKRSTDLEAKAAEFKPPPRQWTKLKDF